MTTDAQKRALWSAAFIDLADALRAGVAPLPTSAQIWTQDISPDELLTMADNSYTEPLPIRILPTFAGIDIPTGEPLGLGLTWTMHADLEFEGSEKARRDFRAHNSECHSADAE